ncbi:hypothetical protein, partial [Amycolatopsis sp. NPDC003731]
MADRAEHQIALRMPFEVDDQPPAPVFGGAPLAAASPPLTARGRQNRHPAQTSPPPRSEAQTRPVVPGQGTLSRLDAVP